MRESLPIGKTESQGLEFKGVDSFRKPLSIGREIVGMLNAEQGGEVWVGVGEEDGLAVSVQPVEDLSTELDSLWNHIVDTIEPSPMESEVRLDPVSVAEGRHVMRIRVNGRPDRRPTLNYEEAAACMSFGSAIG